MANVREASIMYGHVAAVCARNAAEALKVDTVRIAAVVHISGSYAPECGKGIQAEQSYADDEG